jgi:hypothetical protein
MMGRTLGSTQGAPDPNPLGMKGTFTRRFYGLSSGWGCLHEPE